MAQLNEVAGRHFASSQIVGDHARLAHRRRVDENYAGTGGCESGLLLSRRSERNDDDPVHALSQRQATEVAVATPNAFDVVDHQVVLGVVHGVHHAAQALHDRRCRDEGNDNLDRHLLISPEKVPTHRLKRDPGSLAA